MASNKKGSSVKSKKENEKVQENVAKEELQEELNTEKVGYRIILKTDTAIIIDKHGINVKIKLPKEEILRYNIEDMYFL